MVRSITRAASFAALTFILVVPARVSAHAALVSAVPGPGDAVVGSPETLSAKFDQNLDPSRTSLQVRNDAGVIVARGGEPGAGPREFRLMLPELAPGTYKVYWTSFSTEDDELARGTYTFSVVPAPTVAPTAVPSPTSGATVAPSTAAPSPPVATPSPTSAPALPSPTADESLAVIPIAAAALLAAGLIVWMTRRKPR